MARLNTAEMVLISIACFLAFVLFALIIYFFFIKKSTNNISYINEYKPTPVNIETPVIQRNDPVTPQEILDGFRKLNTSQKVSVAKSIDSFLNSEKREVNSYFQTSKMIPVERREPAPVDTSFYGDNLER